MTIGYKTKAKCAEKQEFPAPAALQCTEGQDSAVLSWFNLPPAPIPWPSEPKEKCSSCRVLQEE